MLPFLPDQHWLAMGGKNSRFAFPTKTRMSWCRYGMSAHGILGTTIGTPPEQRQEWKDLPRCRPQAQAAHDDGYNGGQDEFGRQVKNPAGIDLADGTWADLDLPDNDWVVVEFLWTAEVSVSAGRPPSPVPTPTSAPTLAPILAVEPKPPRWALGLTGIVPSQALDDMAILEIGGKDYVIRAGSNMILVVDISDPALPVEVSRLDLRGEPAGPFNRAAIDTWGYHAFVVTKCSNISSSKLISVDVADPLSPKLIGQSECVSTPSRTISYLDARGETSRASFYQDWPHIVAIQGQAYVGVARGIKVFDIGNPSSPRLVRLLETEGVVRGMVSVGSNLYVAEWMGDRGSKLSIIDASGTTPPRATTSVVFAMSNYLGGLRIQAVDGRVYVLQKGDRSKLVVHVVAATTPASPHLVGDWEIETPQGDYLCYPEIAGGYLYVPTPTYQEGRGYSTQLLAVQLANLSEPLPSGWLGMGNWIGCSAVETTGNLLVLANPSGMTILDVSDPGAAQQVGSFNGDTHVNGGAVSWPYAYLTTRQSFIVVDVSVPDSPHVVSSLWFPESGWLGEVVISDGYAYVSGGPSRVIDVSDPRSPHEVAVMDGVSSEAGVQLHGSLLYVLGTTRYHGSLEPTSGVAVVDVSEPREPRVMAAIPGFIQPNGMKLQEGYLYLTGYMEGLGGSVFAIVDTSNPENPRTLGTVQIPIIGDEFQPQTAITHMGVLEIKGSYAYVASKGDDPMLSVIDISNPSSPAVVGTTPIKPDRHGLVFTVRDMDIQGRLAVLVGASADAGSAKGISVIDISDPEQPREIGEYPGAPSSIILDLPLAYVSGTSNSVLLDLSVPADPRQLAFGVGGKIIGVSDPMRYFLANYSRGFVIVQVTTTSTPLTPTPTPPAEGEVRSIAGRVTAVNVQENSFVLQQPKEEREFTVRLGQETKFIRLVFPFDINNPPAGAAFTPERELITIEDLKIGDQVFVRSSNPIRTGDEIEGPLEVQVLP